MSRNSIRQNQIELIYRVNSESFNMTKVWTLLLLKHKLLVNRRGALLTLRWESVSKMTRWKSSYCNTPVDSMINIFLSAPVTILPLKKMLLRLFLKSSHFTDSHKERKIGSPVIVTYFKCQTSQKSILSVLTSEIVWAPIMQGVVIWCVVSYISNYSSCLTITTLYATLGSTWGEEVCCSLYQELNLWRPFFLMCHYFVKCFTINQAQNNKWPKSHHGSMTKKGSVPFVYRIA